MSSVVNLDRYRAAKAAKVKGVAKTLADEFREQVMGYFPNMTRQEANLLILGILSKSVNFSRK